MARTINFQGRTIQVPDAATDEQVRQILQAQPASAPASGQPDVMAEALAAGSAASRSLTPLEAEPEPSNGVMDLLGYAGHTAAIAGDRFGEGMANVAGLPVDALNFMTELGFRGADTIIPGDQSWLKTSPNPIGGSDNLNQARTLFGATGYEAPVPQDAFQTIVGRVGEELGGAALPVVGLGAAGLNMGASAARNSSNAFVRSFVAPAAASPAKFLASEVGGAAAAGTGAGIANLFSDRETTGGQMADMAGALGGAGLFGAAGVIGGGLKNVFNALRQNPNYIDQTVKDAAVDRIGKASGLDSVDGPMDTDPLVELLTNSDTTRPSDIVPGFQESLADVTQNPGLAALEFSRQSGPNSGQFASRRSTNNEAVDQVMQMLEPQQTPGAFRSELETQRDLRLSAAADDTQTTQSEFDRYMQSLQPRMLAEERGATIREGLDNAHRSAREVEDMAWTGIDGLVDPAPLANSLDATRGGLTQARQQAVSDLDPTVDIPRNLAQGPETEVFDLANPISAKTEGETMSVEIIRGKDGRPEALYTDEGILQIPEAYRDLPPEEIIVKQLGYEDGTSSATPKGQGRAPADPVNVRELMDMRSKLLDERRAALSGERPDTNRANAISALLDDVNGYLDSDAVDPAVRAQFDDARGVSRDVNEQFKRPNDPIAQTLARSEGRPDVPDSAVGPRFVQPDNKQASNIDRLLATTDLTSHGGSVREAVKDEILGGLERQKALADPDKMEGYLNQFTKAFDRFPDLRDEVSQAITAGRSADEAAEAQTALTRDLGTPDTPGRGTVGRYLTYNDATSERAFTEVLNSKDPARAADELMNFVGDNPSAVEGARAAFWQKLRTEGQSTDNAQRSMGGTRAWRGDWLKSFLEKPATAAVAERLYRDNPEALTNIRDLATVLDNVDLRQRGKAVGTSGTAQGVNPVLTPETLQSRFYAYMRGQVSGTYLATSIAAVVARRAVRNAQTEAIERLTDKALLNPDFAAELLKENNPANRAALAKKVRTWMGNEASTFLNLMDQEDEETDGPGSGPLKVTVSAGSGYSGLTANEPR